LTSAPAGRPISHRTVTSRSDWLKSLGLPELNRKNEGAAKPALAARIAIESGAVVVDASGEIFGEVSDLGARA
jgi:hypothetical protein